MTAKEFFKKHNPLLFDVMERWEDTIYITNLMNAFAEHITVVMHDKMPGITISPTEFDTSLNTYSNYTDYKEKNKLK